MSGERGIQTDLFIFLLSFPGETSGLCKAICWASHCFILKVSAFRHSALLISHYCLKGRFFMIWGFAFMKFTLCFWSVFFFFAFLFLLRTALVWLMVLPCFLLRGEFL